MSHATPPSTSLEMLDLRHFTGRQLSTVLATETRLWRERLRWDYSSSATLLEQYIDSRVLPGIVALDRGRVVGYCFCVYEGHKAVLGDAFALETANASALANTRAVVGELLDMLDHSPGLHRIESQLLLYPEGEIDAAFLARDYKLYARLYMERDLLAHPPGAAANPLWQPEQWTPECYQPTAELILAAYEGNIDAEINDQYRSLHGTLRFLHNIIRFPGCGTFDPASSFVIRSSAGILLGAVLASRISPTVAHIAQLCVAPTHQRRGIGRQLLSHALERLAANGYTHATLTATEANSDATQLYRNLGFRTTQRFHAMTRILPHGEGWLGSLTARR